MSSPGPPSPALGRPLTRMGDLVQAGLVAPERLDDLSRVARRYAVAITPAVAEQAAVAPDGPVARQYVPSAAELETDPVERADPIGDDAHSPVPGIVHRYPDRVLLKLTGTCAVYCRFCFRRETVGPGKSETLSGADLERALAYIRSDPAIWEVILTGGDPLVLSPRRLLAVAEALGAAGHVRVLRVHTRVPVVDPARITRPLVDALGAFAGALWIVLHVNHADEISPAVRDGLRVLSGAGIPLLSQSVLLRGVNDDPESLERLFRTLVENRVKPYYLHHPDLAPGTGHFRTGLDQGRALMKGLRGRVSGLCQPTYVLDIPGGHGKAPVGPCFASEEEGGTVVEDWRGTRHAYPPRGTAP